MVKIKYLERGLRESTVLKVYDYLTEKLQWSYGYDSYILNTRSLILYKDSIEVFRINIKQISEISGGLNYEYRSIYIYI